MEDEPFSTSSSMEMGDLEGESLTSKKTTVVYKDPVADMLLSYYRKLYLEDAEMSKFVILVAPFALILFFYMFVSQGVSSIISFSAFIISLVFIGISIWMLCEILKKDVGPRGMQDIAEVIREGSEGFFVT
jgi:hypothetical protein